MIHNQQTSLSCITASIQENPFFSLFFPSGRGDSVSAARTPLRSLSSKKGLFQKENSFRSSLRFGNFRQAGALTNPERELPEGKAKNLIRRYIILGERRSSNYLWSFLILLGSCGFLLTGLCSYYGSNLFPFLQVKDVSFFPQGLLMSFYGSLGLLLSFYWWFNIFWNVGGGFNEFNKKEGKIRIFRWGYPGKNRRIDLSYALKDVEAIKVEFKQGLDSQRTIYLKLKGSLLREIPLTGIGEPLTLKEIEKQASELANFLQVSLEGL